MEESAELDLLNQFESNFGEFYEILMNPDNDEACETIIKLFDDFFEQDVIPETDEMDTLLNGITTMENFGTILIKLTALYCKRLNEHVLTCTNHMLIRFLSEHFLMNPTLSFTVLFLFIKLLLEDEETRDFILEHCFDTLIEDINRLLQIVFNNNFYKKSDVCSCMDLIAVLITKTERDEDTCNFLNGIDFLENFCSLLLNDESYNDCGVAVFNFASYVITNNQNSDINEWMEPFFDELIKVIEYFDSMTFGVKKSFLNFVCSYILSHDEMTDAISDNLEMILKMSGFMNESHDLEIFKLTIPILHKIKEKYEMDDTWYAFPVYIDVISSLYRFIDNTNDRVYFEDDLCSDFLTFVDAKNLL